MSTFTKDLNEPRICKCIYAVHFIECGVGMNRSKITWSKKQNNFLYWHRIIKGHKTEEHYYFILDSWPDKKYYI